MEVYVTVVALDVAVIGLAALLDESIRSTELSPSRIASLENGGSGDI